MSPSLGRWPAGDGSASRFGRLTAKHWTTGQDSLSRKKWGAALQAIVRMANRTTEAFRKSGHSNPFQSPEIVVRIIARRPMRTTGQSYDCENL